MRRRRFPRGAEAERGSRRDALDRLPQKVGDAAADGPHETEGRLGHQVQRPADPVDLAEEVERVVARDAAAERLGRRRERVVEEERVDAQLGRVELPDGRDGRVDLRRRPERARDLAPRRDLRKRGASSSRLLPRKGGEERRTVRPPFNVTRTSKGKRRTAPQ